MESIPPLGEPSSWGSLLLLSLPASSQLEWVFPFALFVLLLGGNIAITAALAAYQQFLSNTTSGSKTVFPTAALYQEPEKVVLAGVFLASTLHLLAGLCGYWLLTLLFAFYPLNPWGLTIGALAAAATVLLVLRGYFSRWGRRRQEAASSPVLVSVLEVIQTLGSPFVSLLLPLRGLVGQTRTAFGTPSPSEELSHSLDQTPTEPASPEEKGLLKAIVNFSAITVKQIMRSRVDVIALHRRLPFPALLKQIHQCGYSRIPVYTHGLDKLDGILYVKDLLPYLNAPANFVWQNLIRTPYFVPETKKIDELLREFQERRVHMAIVVNEYGETTGLITLEDVIEEIVGEIHDELDEEEDHYYTQLDEHTFLFEGRTSLHDFCKVVDAPAELLKDIKGDVESVAGLMLRLFSRIPHTGDETQLGPYVFRIEAADSKRVKKVRVHEAVPHPHNEKE
ncbi:transporter associated domain-containing protein [Rufibacter sp. XAAS-G3-1]|uniref:transporter associated domain-containing protein n=1 Tax=Rufibacter sp. XAAS-G3-1 TaxID=2729134 RepID=UPI0015E74005|nr:transporter associated domain-containing protein [Rufibacter sp. XAAS-G3-1]